MKARSILLVLAFCACAAGLHAQAVVSGFTETGNLPRNDDNNSSAINLGFSLNFYGTSYSQTYVSNNGYLTFGQGQGEYSPSGLGAGYSGLPIISAFFDDVDTRNAATGIVSWGTGTFQGRTAFAATWPNVGEFSNGSSPNTFQIILVERSDTGIGNFDIYFNYNTITWDHGGAAAGYNNGISSAPVFYQLAGSLQSGAFVNGGPNALATNSNIFPTASDYALGRYLFQARNGDFVPPPPAVPEPSTYVLLVLGAGVMGSSIFRRRRHAA